MADGGDIILMELLLIDVCNYVNSRQKSSKDNFFCILCEIILTVFYNIVANG